MKYSNSLFSQSGFVTAVAVLIGVYAVVPAAYGQATPTTSVSQVPFVTGGVPACGGDTLAISGTVNMITHESTGPNGATFFVNNFNFQDAKVTDLTTGAKGTTAENSQAVVITPISANVIHVTLNAHITIQSEGLDTGSTMVFGIVFNANGQPTVTLEHAVLTCPPA